MSAEELLVAAHSSLAAGDYERAQAAAEQSLAQAESAEAHDLLARLCLADDRFAEMQQHLEAAFRMYRDSGNYATAARIAIDLATHHAAAQGNVAAGRGWAERARVLLERVGPCVHWGYLELASMACDRTDIDDLLASADRALATAIEFGDSDLEAQAMADSGLGLVTQGRLTEGFARLDAALAAISAGEVTPFVAGVCFCSMLTACDRAGDLRRAEEWVRLIDGIVAGAGNKPRALHTHCRVAYGSVLCAAGRWPEAEALLIEALGPADSPSLAHRALTVAHLAALRVQQGRIEEAADLLAPFEDRITSCEPLAQIYLRQGDLDLAAAVLRRGLKEMIGDVLRMVPLDALLVEVEIGRGDLDAAAVVADDLARTAQAVPVKPVKAEVVLAQGRLAMAKGERDTAIERFEAAKSLLDGDERPLQLGLVRLELAEVHAAVGDTAAAITEARAALSAFDRLGATSARDRAMATLRALGGQSRRTQVAPSSAAIAGLTGREREVLELVRQGLTNAEIADRLYISAKTVEHHVGRVLSKLGVRSRAEAAALATRLAAQQR